MITLDFGQECVRVLLRSRINYHFHAFPFLAFPGSHQCWLTSPCSLARNYPTGRRIPPVVAVIKLYQHRPLQPERAPLRCFETPPHPDLSQHCLTYPTLLLPHPSAALLNTALLFSLFHLFYPFRFASSQSPSFCCVPLCFSYFHPSSLPLPT